MSAWHDVIDWAGGYPYEFAGKGEVTQFFSQRGFGLSMLRDFGRIIKMHEYVFTPSVDRQRLKTSGISC
jgi:hypothetical protein